MPSYNAYVRRDRLPTIAVLSRALSSRGWRVDIESEADLASLAGALPLKIDGEAVTVEMRAEPGDSPAVESVRSAAEEHGRQEMLAVLKDSDLRLSFEAESSWGRDIARTVALLSVGAFEDPSKDTLIRFGG